MVGGLLREGNAGPAENADTWIPHLVQRLTEGTNRDLDQFHVRLDAGFTEGETLRALDAHDIAYPGQLRSNKALQTLATPSQTAAWATTEDTAGMVPRLGIPGRELGVVTARGFGRAGTNR